MAEKRVIRIPPPVRGEERVHTTQPPNSQRCQTLTNLLPGIFEDRVVGRGSIVGDTPYMAAAGMYAVGAAPRPDSTSLEVLTGHSTTEPQREITGTQVAEADLQANSYHVGSGTGVTAAVYATKDNVPEGSRSVRIGDAVYYLTMLTVGVAARTLTGTLNTINSRRVASHTFGGGVVVRNTGPMYSADIAEYSNRLFVLGGTVPNAAAGAGTYNANGLYFSDADGPTTDTLTLWQDDVSGNANQLTVGESDDYGVALCNINNGLVVLKRRSIWVLRGSGPQTFQLRRFSAEVGCVSRDSVVPWRDGCLFASDAGIYYFDGSQMRLVSAHYIDPTTYTGVLATARFTPLGQGWFHILDGNSSECLFHAPTDSFCGFSSGSTFSNLTPMVGVAEPNGNAARFLGGYRLLDYSQVVAYRRGQDMAFGGRDYLSNSFVTYAVIDHTLATHPVQLGNPMEKSVVTRVMAETRVQGQTDGDSGSFTLTGTDEYKFDNSRTPAAEDTFSGTIPYVLAPTTSPADFYPMRTTFDVMKETETYKLVYSLPGPTQAQSSSGLEYAAIFNTYVEWQQTRQSRSA